MPTRDDIVLLASYNAAMNTRLYAAAATLPQDALRADRGAFFGSLIGTLNHIVAGDSIWLRRFMGHPAGFSSLQAMAALPAPTGLAWRYSDELETLLEHRVRLDAIMSALAGEVSDRDLAQTLVYRNAQGECRKNFGALLLHLFNHQTHHRGQASTLLSQSGADIGVTDLIEWIPDHSA